MCPPCSREPAAAAERPSVRFSATASRRDVALWLPRVATNGEDPRRRRREQSCRGADKPVILRSPPLTRDEESLRWADGETLRAIPDVAALRVTLLSFAPAAGRAGSRLRVGRAANRPAPHRSGRADFPHPVPQQDGFAARAQPRRCTDGAGNGKRARSRLKRFQGIGAPRVRRDSHLRHMRVSLKRRTLRGR